MILLIDNFDSFTYNLQDYLGRLGHEVKVIRYDRLDNSSLQFLNIEGIVISPGPGKPTEYPKHFDIYKSFMGMVPILGVCLGHQSIGCYMGGILIKGKKPMHGKLSRIEHDGTDLFYEIPNNINVTRYHSLVLNQVPKNLTICAKTTNNEIMAFKDVTQKIWGVQFHPEAYLTQFGNKMVENWLNIIDKEKKILPEIEQLSEI